MSRLAILPLALLVACQPEPRSAGYFQAHPEEARRVMQDCRAGAHRGGECDTAQAGLAAYQADKRLEVFKKSFE
jgi:hypothetical protein